MTPPPHVLGMLVDVLDPRVPGASTNLTPVVGEPNTFQGILDWRKREGSILAPTVFSKTGGVRRNLTTNEMAQVMDFPVCRTERMKETDLSLLIDGDVPGKVIQGAIYFLAQWNSGIETPLRVKRSLEEWEQPSNKRGKFSEGLPSLGVLRFDEEEEEKGEEGRRAEEKVSDVQVLEFDDYDEVLVKEAASQKATRSDNVGTSVQ